ncbi:MAG TPA: acyl-CoA thioesterase/BAAT N-terminal domain-containing protein [Candidatus Eisenbacteria bacterium]|nr:acyl-CoA thioesterase/BAAT N-terminal domain-containing protein [Candidatus Eisenbacteria bacterium]
MVAYRRVGEGRESSLPPQEHRGPRLAALSRVRATRSRSEARCPRVRALAELLLTVALGAPACQPGVGPPRILVDHATELADAPLVIRVEGVPAAAAITVQSAAQGSMNRPLASSAAFTTGPDGRVDLSRTAPRPGSSYAGVDGLGLIWSLLPKDEGPPALPNVAGDAEVIRLTAAAAGGRQATATVRRLLIAPGSRGAT